MVKNIKEATTKKVRFIIIGDGELRDELENYCNQLEIDFSTEKNATNALLTFTSWITDIDVALAGLDIVALTSKNEGTPVSLIEAQAAGKPIVSVNVGGIENIVIPNETALLSNINDEQLFTENMLSLIEDDNKRIAFSQKGTHVFKSFHYDRLVCDMEKLYCQLLQ